MNKAVQWLKGLSVSKKILLGFGVVVLLSVASGGHQNTANLTATNTAKINTSSSPKKPAKTTKTETETQSIPFTSTTVQDSNLPKGTNKVTTVGVNGSETLTYKVTYTDGKQTSKQLVSTTVTTQPITQVTSIGTYVAPPPPPPPSCPNGSYVNSDGNTVCSPYSSPSAPAGATALCQDGTYSFSQHRSGTCSHHGGVAQWL